MQTQKTSEEGEKVNGPQPGEEEKDDGGRNEKNRITVYDGQTREIETNKGMLKDCIFYILEYNQDTHKDTDAQHALFNVLSIIKLTRGQFVDLKKECFTEMKHRADFNRIKMEYHAKNSMISFHLDSVTILKIMIDWYFGRWREETQKNKLNMFEITKLTKTINETAVLLSQFNVGVPVLMYIKSKIDSLENSTKIVKVVPDLYSQIQGTGNKAYIDITDNGNTIRQDNDDKGASPQPKPDNAGNGSGVRGQHANDDDELPVDGKEGQPDGPAAAGPDKGGRDTAPARDTRRAKEAVF